MHAKWARKNYRIPLEKRTFHLCCTCKKITDMNANFEKCTEEISILDVRKYSSLHISIRTIQEKSYTLNLAKSYSKVTHCTLGSCQCRLFCLGVLWNWCIDWCHCPGCLCFTNKWLIDWLSESDPRWRVSTVCCSIFCPLREQSCGIKLYTGCIHCVRRCWKSALVFCAVREPRFFTVYSYV